MRRLFERLNTGRQKWLEEELKVLRRLPSRKLPICKLLTVSVSGEFIIRVGNNTYSVDSRLIGEEVRHYIQYRHIIFKEKTHR